MSNADYTTPDMGQKYRSSKFIYDKIMEVEKKRRSERTPNADALRNGRPPHRQVL